MIVLIVITLLIFWNQPPSLCQPNTLCLVCLSSVLIVVDPLTMLEFILKGVTFVAQQRILQN